MDKKYENLKKLHNIIDKSELLIFDGDGTAYDTLGMWDSVDYQLISTIGGCIDKKFVGKQRDDFLHNNNTGDVFLKYAEFIKDKYNPCYSTDSIEELRNTIAKNYLRDVKFKDGFAEFLKTLKQKNKKLCLATLSSKWVIDLYFSENCNLKPFKSLFDLVLTKEDVNFKKPDPEIYNKATESLNIKKNNSLIFEDSLTGIMSAKNAEIEVIKVKDSHTSQEDVKKIQDYTDLYLDSWTDLAL